MSAVYVFNGHVPHYLPFRHHKGQCNAQPPGEGTRRVGGGEANEERRDRVGENSISGQREQVRKSYLPVFIKAELGNAR